MPRVSIGVYKNAFLSCIPIFAALLLLVSLDAAAQEEAQSTQPSEIPQNRLSVDDIHAMGMLGPPEGVTFQPVPGAWARYRLTNKVDKSVRYLSVGIVGRKPLAAGLATWLEIATESRSGTPVVLKMLWLPGHKVSALRRLVLKTGDHPPLELSVKDWQRPKRRMSGVYKEVDERRIQVEAGEFLTTLTERSSMGDGPQKIWHTSAIAPFGLVRAMNDTYELELVAYGRDYEAKISGKPMQLQTGKPPLSKTPPKVNKNGK